MIDISSSKQWKNTVQPPSFFSGTFLNVLLTVTLGVKTVLELANYSAVTQHSRALHAPQGGPEVFCGERELW